LIRYDLGNNKAGEVDVIDIAGRVIATMPVHGSSGEFALTFNQEVCDGVYFLMLKAGRGYIVRKVLVLY
jgi:hypothetical protein